MAKDKVNRGIGTLPNTSQKLMDRIRFNWGYWDARADVAAGRFREITYFKSSRLFAVSQAFDTMYYWGYVKGKASASIPSDSSDSAWAEYLAD